MALVEVEAVGATNDYRFQDDEDQVAAAFNVADGINPRSMVIPVTRIAGVTTVISRPAGGLISGQGLAFDLIGDNIADMQIRSPIAMFGSVSENEHEAGGGTRGGLFMRLREVLEDARVWDAQPAGVRARRDARVLGEPAGPGGAAAGAARRDAAGGGGAPRQRHPDGAAHGRRVRPAG